MKEHDNGLEVLLRLVVDSAEPVRLKACRLVSQLLLTDLSQKLISFDALSQFTRCMDMRPVTPQTALGILEAATPLTEYLSSSREESVVLTVK